MGVTEHKFNVENTIFRIFDVGEHRSQRQFWAPYFDDVDAIIFMAAISAFDQKLEEDEDVNRMDDSIELFNKICNNELFTNTGIILFLNKIDIFKQKLTTTKVKDYFPGYEGKQYFGKLIDTKKNIVIINNKHLYIYIGDNKYSSVSKYFEKLFLNCNQNEKRPIYRYFTHATVSYIHTCFIIYVVLIIIINYLFIIFKYLFKMHIRIQNK